MNIPKPSFMPKKSTPVPPTTTKSVRGVTPAGVIIDELVAKSDQTFVPNPKPSAPKPRATSVRNPAFRDHAGLKDLQRQLHNKNVRTN